MKTKLSALVIALVFSTSLFASPSANLYEDTSDDTANFGPNTLSVQPGYFRTLEQVRDATVLVAEKSGFGSGIILSLIHI